MSHRPSDLQNNPSESADRIRLNLVLHLADLGYWDFAPGDVVLDWSARAKRFFGLPPDGIVTFDRFIASIHAEDRDRTERAIRAALDHAIGAYQIEFRAIGIEDGIERIIVAAGSVLFDDEHRPTRVIGVSRDVTQTRRHERELSMAKKEAECASYAKSQFLANMSHEIRTPLGAILGFTDLATDADFSEEQRREFIARIRANGELLSQLIDQILDLSKIEANQFEIERATFDLSAALREIMTTMTVKANQRNLDLVLRSRGPVPVDVETDELRLKQILLNLVGNAIKFTPRGRVTVEVFVASAVEPGKRMTIGVAVRDTGIGISLEKRRQLFDRFNQGDNSMTRHYGGSGLGLSLSKELALALGGDLILQESTPERGSTFVFFFADSVYAPDTPMTTLDEGFRVGPREHVGGADGDATSDHACQYANPRTAPEIQHSSPGPR